MQKRMVSRIGFGLLGISLGVCVSLVLLAESKPSSAQPAAPKAEVSYPNAPKIHAQGVPALKPSRPGSSAAFTADELRQFLTSNDAPLGIKGMPKVTISRVDCGLTAGNVSDIVHGKSFAVPPDTAVCYAELSGEFTFPIPSSSRPGSPASLTFHKAFRVYDAKTGNAIAVGAFQ